MSVPVCVLVMILSLSGSSLEVEVGVGISGVLSSDLLSLCLRCCLFLCTGPEGVFTRKDLGVPAFVITLPGVWLVPVVTHTDESSGSVSAGLT